MSWVEFLTPVAGIAAMLKAWLEMRKAALELNTVTEEQRKTVLAAGEAASAELPAAELQPFFKIIIARPILKQAVKNIRSAEDRFSQAMGDVRYTPAQVDQEAAIVRSVICHSLQLIRDHNGGELPPGQCVDWWNSYRCDKSFL